MSELKRKLEEYEKATAEAEQKIEALKKSRAEAEAEAARLKPLVQLEQLRSMVAEVKRLPESDKHGRPVRVAMLVDYALREMGQVAQLLFTLPLGRYDAGKRYPEYYDGSHEPLPAEDTKEGIYVVAAWRWEDGPRHWAKIFADGTVELINAGEDQCVNVLNLDPETWTKVVCRGKPEEEEEEDEDEDDEEDEDEEEEEEEEGDKAGNWREL